MDATRERIKRLRVDALYGKKKHFNAADRKANNNDWLTIPVAIINALLGTVILADFKKDDPETFKWVTAPFAIGAAVLSTLAAIRKLAEKVEGHRRVGNKYLAIVKSCEHLLAYDIDGIVNKEEIVKRFDVLTASIVEINKEAEAFPTNDDDYAKAKKGIEGGEESYLPQELSI